MEKSTLRRISVKSATEIAKKWALVTPARASYYELEAPAAGGKWEERTTASGGVYKAAISAAGIQDRFVGGVKKAGAAKFSRKVKDVGVDRYAPGVAAAEADMAKGVAPFRDILDGLEIPDRGPRGSPGNYAIGQKVGDALHKGRLALLAATA